MAHTFPCSCRHRPSRQRRSVTGYVGISYDLTERKRADEYIYHVAHHDPLTGSLPAPCSRDRLEVAIERGRRSQDTLAVMMVDLDNFKRVNDSSRPPGR